MTAGFKYFTSADVGAPVLNNAAGCMVALLDWVLDIADPVNGWQKVYSGTSKAAYRPRVGLRYYLRIEDILGLAFYTRGYESMTDVDTGVDPFPLLTKFTLPQFGGLKTSTNSATARAYWGIKTARYFLLVISGAGTAAADNYVFAFGEVPTIHTGENYPFIVTGNGSNPGITATAQGLCSTGATTALGGGNMTVANASFSVPVTWARNPSGSIKAVAGVPVVSGGSFYPITEGSRVALRRADVSYGTAQTGAGASSGTLTPRSYVPHLWTTNADLAGATWNVGDVFQMPDYNPSANFVWLGFNNTVNIILETTDTAGSM